MKATNSVAASAARSPPIRTRRRAPRSRSPKASDLDLESVIGADDLQRRPIGADQLLVTDGFGVHALDVLVRIGRLVVEQGQLLGAGRMAEVDGHHVGRMAPVLLEAHR